MAKLRSVEARRSSIDLSREEGNEIEVGNHESVIEPVAPKVVISRGVNTKAEASEGTSAAPKNFHLKLKTECSVILLRNTICPYS